MVMTKSSNGLVRFQCPYHQVKPANRLLVIVLIAAEILVAAINIVVDLYVGE